MPATLADKLTARVQKNQAEDIATYRAAVTAAAAGEDLSAKKVDELAEVLARLDLTPATFTADVNAYQGYVASKAAVERLPDRAEADRHQADHIAAVARIEREIQEKRVELGQTVARFQMFQSGQMALRQGLEASISQNPRLLGEWPTKKPVAAPVVPMAVPFGSAGY